MKLTKQAKELAKAIFDQKFIEQAEQSESELRRIRGQGSNAHKIIQFYLERTKKTVYAKVQSYVEAYKREGREIDEEDKQEIIDEVSSIIQSRVRYLAESSTIPEFRIPNTFQRIPNLDQQIRAEFERLLGPALAELSLASAQLAMESKSSITSIILEDKIREIIRNNYGFKDQNIESEEIYNKLIQQGVEVPELAMDEIFNKLRKDKLIKGRARLNRDARHKHGATAIMWVSRYI